MTRPTAFCLLAGLLIAAAPLRAQPVISLPLDGYYRPGKFFPVHIESNQPIAATIDLDGGVGSEGAGTSFTLPAMALSASPTSVRVTIDGHTTELAVRALGDNETLVAATADDLIAGPARKIVGAADLVPVMLDPSQLPTFSLAWQSLDWLLLTEADRVNRPVVELPELLACGPRVAIRSANTPDVLLPWRRLAGTLVLDGVRGPSSAIDQPAVYDAALAFSAERAPALRRNVMVAMSAFAILLLGGALLQFRRVWVLAVAISIGWTAAAGAWFGAQSPVRTLDGRVTVHSPLPQDDEWMFRTTLAKTPDAFGGSVKTPSFPVFEDAINPLAMKITVDDRGWIYRYTLPAGGKIAFVTRRLGAIVREPTTRPIDGVISSLAKSAYAKPGEMVESINPTWAVVPK